jgi:hypothetical protein
MAVTSERLLNALGRITADAEVKALLRDLDYSWIFGDRYLSIAFYRDPSRGIMRVTCGLEWVL